MIKNNIINIISKTMIFLKIFKMIWGLQELNRTIIFQKSKLYIFKIYNDKMNLQYK